MNGGTCIDGVDNFTCSCPPKLTGPLCECLILDDENYDCEYVSSTPLTSSTQSVLSTLLERSTTERSTSPELSSTYTSPNDSTAVLTTAGETTPTNVIGSSTPTETEPATSTGLTTWKETDVTPVTSEVGANETTTKGAVTEPTEHEETRATIESDNAKIDATTECHGFCAETTKMSTAETDMTTSSAESTKVVLPVDVTEQITSSSTTTITASSSVTTEEVLDITTTPKVDVSTDKMFTDIPTDRPITDHTVTDSTLGSSTTETVEVTSATDTEGHFTTVQSECTDSICNDHGTCINTPHGIRVSNFDRNCHRLCFFIISHFIQPS